MSTNRRIEIKTLRLFSIIILLLCGTIISKAQSVQWLTFEEAFEKSKEDKRKFIIDIYTDWCKWCKKMDQTTFSDSAVIAVINNNYYAIKFDAEQKDPIEYQNNTYNYETRIWRGGYHQLAAKITNNNVKLPSVVFLDENTEILQSIGGYRNAYEMEMMAAFFSGDYHKSTPWKNFVAAFQLKKYGGQIKNDSSSHNPTRMVSNNQKN